MGTAGTRRRLVAWSAGALAIVAAAAVILPIAISSPARAEIDGVILSGEELALGADRTTRAVEQAGGDAEDARTAAVEALRDDLALLQVAGDLGVTDVERPSDILDELDGVNAARAEAHRSGEVIYGPVAYSAATFYSKSLSEIREACVQAALRSDDSRFRVADDDIRERFDEEPEQWASAATSVSLTVAWTAEADPTAAQPALAAALTGGSADGIRLESIVVSDAELVDGTWNPETAETIRALEIGGVAGPEPSRTGWAAYRLDARETDADAAFGKYRERIRAVLLDERLDAMIADARATQNVSD